jgi:hypothetical protein
MRWKEIAQCNGDGKEIRNPKQIKEGGKDERKVSRRHRHFVAHLRRTLHRDLIEHFIEFGRFSIKWAIKEAIR